MDNRLNKIAILVDGDNAQPKLMKAILEEVAKYGKATIRRIYGDWTDPKMTGWKDLLNDLSFSPIQKFSYTAGKNSTDSALIIDAMDILHNNLVNGFCIVSSDSDYTGLAKRIREDGIFVMGVGEKKTPSAFVQSCEIFTYCENISQAIMQLAISSNKGDGGKSSAIDMNLIERAFLMSVGEGSEAYISAIGQNIRKMDSSFDPRAYGFSNLTQLFAHLDGFEIINNVVNGLNHPLVKRHNSSK